MVGGLLDVLRLDLAALRAEALKVAWLDGARTGLAAGLLLGLLAGYLLWRKRP